MWEVAGKNWQRSGPRGQDTLKVPPSTHSETLRVVHKYQMRLAEQVFVKHLLGWLVGD